jgi:CLIP-associating protein 1/2
LSFFGKSILPIQGRKLIEFHRNAPEHAKTDLKKQMVNRGVRKTIESFVISQLGIRNSGDIDLAASTISLPVIPLDSFQADTGLADSVMSEQPPPQEAVPMDPLYVHTLRELEDIFREMAPHFEGKETEHNWMARDKDILKLRRLNKGNAPSEFLAAYVIGLKSVLDGILKVANSLRTTVSTNGCQCVQELARSLGPSLDPMVELLIQNFIKMSANTKPIASNNGSTTVEILLSNVSYKERLMQHMLLSFQEKNVQTRTYASGWLKTLIKKHAAQKSHIEHSGGAELAEKCLKKGLADANPKVRENTRATYWAFAQIWPARAEA